MLTMTPATHRHARAPLLGWTRIPAAAAALSAPASPARSDASASQRGRPYQEFTNSELATMGRRCSDSGDAQGVTMVLDELALRSNAGARRLRERMLLPARPAAR